MTSKTAHDLIEPINLIIILYIKTILSYVTSKNSDLRLCLLLSKVIIIIKSILTTTECEITVLE